jgi:BirA family transcriptional regulator, biotin operon repressor / biotin---[acetyl-CoA-carboxylase] ligase
VGVIARITATSTAAHVRLPEGWRLMAFDSIDSTNSALTRMVEAGTEAGEGLVITAKSQTAGRGRSGRTWASPQGNLFSSFLIKSDDGLVNAAQLGFVAALAVIQAIQSLLPDRASDSVLRCKWPNDVLFSGEKISGILLETVSPPDSGDVFVVMGIGLNLVAVDVDQPTYAITSLAQQGRHVTASQALEPLARALARNVDLWRREGFAPMRKAWLAHAAGLGQSITVRLPRETIVGTFLDIDADGAMTLEESPGQFRTVVAGDVILAGS